MEGCFRREVIMAWQVARFLREDRLYGLKYYLDQLKPTKAQTGEEVFAIFQTFVERGLATGKEKPN